MTGATVWRRGRFGAGRVPIGLILPCDYGGGAGRPRVGGAAAGRSPPGVRVGLSWDTPVRRAGWTAGDRPGRLRPVPEIHETALPGVGVPSRLTPPPAPPPHVLPHRH